MDATKDKAQQAKDHAAGTGHDTTEPTKQKAGETIEATKQKAAETTEAAKQKAADALEAAKQKASEASQYAKDSAVAGKDKTGGVVQQATEQVKSAAAGAKDAVMNTLGMGGDQKPAGDTGKDSSTITRDQ